VVLRLPTPGVSPPSPQAHGLVRAQPPSAGPAFAIPHCRPVGEEAWPSGASVLHGPRLCSRLALHARARSPLLCPSFSPSNNPAASPRVPEGYISLIAGLLLAVCSFEIVSRAQDLARPHQAPLEKSPVRQHPVQYAETGYSTTRSGIAPHEGALDKTMPSGEPGLSAREPTACHRC
jgi:hypothetical protein